MTSCYCCICKKKLSRAEINEDVPPNNNCTGAIDVICKSLVENIAAVMSVVVYSEVSVSFNSRKCRERYFKGL
jgi:hypothetical protein